MDAIVIHQYGDRSVLKLEQIATPKPGEGVLLVKVYACGVNPVDYKIRSGIEATNSELKRSHGLGKLRVRRAAKVCFAVACKVIACNIKRWARAHTTSETPLKGKILSILDRLKIFPADLIRMTLYIRLTLS